MNRGALMKSFELLLFVLLLLVGSSFARHSIWDEDDESLVIDDFDPLDDLSDEFYFSDDLPISQESDYEYCLESPRG